MAAPGWHVPFDRNPKFTGREDLLDDIQQRLQQHTHAAKIAVIGLGGVGKTQLMLELVHRMREQCAVIWIPVNNLANLQTAYHEMAKRLCLPGREMNGDHVLELVQTYLSDERIGPGLLVLDSANYFGLWKSLVSLESEQKCLIDLLPKSTQGSIVFAARNRKVGVDLAQDNLVEVPTMDEPGRTQLLQNYLANKELLDTDADALQPLLEKLTYLPLTIVQAASYINKNRALLSHYNVLLSDHEDDLIDLVREDFQDYGRYHDIENPVVMTWKISFEQIYNNDRLAADYVSFIYGMC